MDEGVSEFERADSGAPRCTVVVPVRDSERDLQACLAAIARSSCGKVEVVVVDDASRDGSAGVAEQAGARLIRNASRSGPAASRNTGARAALAPIVFFVDADVELHPEALPRAMERFDRDPSLAALFGSYDDAPTDRSTVSQFRNLLHHYVHQQGEFHNDARPAHTFWTGCGAIRREVFLALGGFDPGLYRRPAIEDIELGYRLTRAGHRIELVRNILATHRKRWTLRSMIRTDVFHRGVPWMLLILWSQTRESDLNVSPSQRISVLLAGILVLSAVAAAWQPAAALFALPALGAIVAINRRFYRFLASRGGAGFAARSVGLHLVYFLCCGVSVAIAVALRLLLTRRAEAPAPGVRIDAPSFPGPRRRRKGSTKWARR